MRRLYRDTSFHIPSSFQTAACLFIGSPWSLSVTNICSPFRKHCAPFSDTVRVHDMFTIDRNKSLVNFTGSDVLRLQKPNHASHLTVGGNWYQRVHCLNLSHSQRGKVCSTNCTRQLSTLYWTHHMTHQLKLNNCAGCMPKRSLLSRCPTYKFYASNITTKISNYHKKYARRKRELYWKPMKSWRANFRALNRVRSRLSEQHRSQ